jgi:hypothetical protein
MRDLAGFDSLSDAIAEGFTGVPGAHGLLFVGSSAVKERRDRWSDHDFLALVDPATAEDARSKVEWLPHRERIVATAREGRLGFTVLYDDAHLLEFAIASPEELAGAPVDEAYLAFGDQVADAFVAQGREAVAGLDQADATNEAVLAFVKMLVGFGRAQRGERIVAGQFVRCWAVRHFIMAVRQRIAPAPDARRDLLDDSRRFDMAYPELAARLDAVLAQPVEDAARALAALARDTLEPAWSDFPTRVADVVQAVLSER